MRANVLLIVVLSIFLASGLGWAGWSLNSDEDKKMIGDFIRRRAASLAWAMGGEVKNSTVCEIVERQHDMDGRKVRLRAQFWSDGLENSGVRDFRCPHRNIGLANGRELLVDDKSRRFEALVWAAHPDGPHLTEVEVEGTVESPPRSAMGSDSVIVAVHRYLSASDAGVDPVWLKIMKDRRLE